MNSVYDVQQLLKRFGILIYVGERQADLELMASEVKELYKSQLIDAKLFQLAIGILRSEIAIEKEKKDRAR